MEDNLSFLLSGIEPGNLLQVQLISEGENTLSTIISIFFRSAALFIFQEKLPSLFLLIFFKINPLVLPESILPWNNSSISALEVAFEISVTESDLKYFYMLIIRSGIAGFRFEGRYIRNYQSFNHLRPLQCKADCSFTSHAVSCKKESLQIMICWRIQADHCSSIHSHVYQNAENFHGFSGQAGKR